MNELELIQKIPSLYSQDEKSHVIHFKNEVAIVTFNDGQINYEIFTIKNEVHSNDFSHFIYDVIDKCVEQCECFNDDCLSFDFQDSYQLISHHDLMGVDYTCIAENYELKEFSLQMFGHNIYMPEKYVKEINGFIHNRIERCDFYRNFIDENNAD